MCVCVSECGVCMSVCGVCMSVWCVCVCVASADGQVSGLEIGECTRMFESVRMEAKRFIFVVMFRRNNPLK